MTRTFFGPNSTDEMCGLLLGVIPVNLDDASLLADARTRKMRECIAELTAEQRSRFHWEDAFEGVGGQN